MTLVLMLLALSLILTPPSLSLPPGDRQTVIHPCDDSRSNAPCPKPYPKPYPNPTPPPTPS